MSTEFPDSFPASQPELSVDTDSSAETPPLFNTPASPEVVFLPRQAEVTQSPFSLNPANPIVAPEIGESQNRLILDVAETVQTRKPAKSTAAKAAEINLKFWVAAVGLGFILLVTVSDWRSKDGPPIPFPSTSKIPQVR